MKKSLLLLAGVALATAASAATPEIIENACLTGVSFNGKYAAGSNPFDYSFTIYNIETGEMQTFSSDDDFYSEGFGHFISDDGLAVGAAEYSGAPVVLENGEWVILPYDPETYYMLAANCISADGNLIAGYAGKSMAAALEGDDEVMFKPVLWMRGEDGNYGMPEVLPYPEKDMTGRAPQSILISAMNEDGTMLVGQVVDASGFMRYPITYRVDDNGDWVYEYNHIEMFNPEEIEIPAHPGESPKAPDGTLYLTEEELAQYNADLDAYNNRVQPTQKDFMTDENRQAYEDALAAYFEDYNNNPYPYITNYMSEEEQAAYNEAINAYWSTPRPNAEDYMSEEALAAYQLDYQQYEEDYAAWEEAFYAFDDVYMYLCATTPEISQNSGRISANGLYAVQTATIAQEDPDSWFGYTYTNIPMIYDLNSEDYYEMSEGQSDAYASTITNSGAILCASPVDDFYSRNAYIASAPGAPLQHLVDYVAENAPALSEWVEANMKHLVYEESYDFDADEWVYNEVEKYITGTPSSDPELGVIVCQAPNSWNYEDDMAPNCYSYILPMKDLSGIGAITASKESAIAVSMDRHGVITISGDAKNVVVYDLNGRVAFRADAPAATVKTGLSKGAYVVKAESVEGKTAIKKAII